MRRENKNPGLGQLLLRLNPDLWGPLLIMKCMYPWLAIDIPDMPPQASAEEIERAKGPKAGRTKA